MAYLDRVSISGTTYNVQDTSTQAGVSNVFSTTKAYSAGQYVWYDGDGTGAKLYRFTSDHASGAWVGTDATQVALSNDVAELKIAVGGLEDICIEKELVSTVYVSGGLSSNYTTTVDNTRIRIQGTDTPILHTGDEIEIGGDFEGKIYASNAVGYGSNVIGEVTSGWTSGRVYIPASYDGKYFGLLLRSKSNPSADISSLVESVPQYVKIYHISKTIDETVDELKITTDSNTAELFTTEAITGVTRDKAWEIQTETPTLVDATGWAVKSPDGYIKVQEGETYRITACQGRTDNVRIWVVTDDNNNILAMADNYNDGTYDKHTSICVVPQGGTRLLLTFRRLNVESPVATWEKISRRYPCDNGLLSVLGITALTNCHEYGFYRCGTSYVQNLTDLPVGYSSNAFNLFVITPAFASASFAQQILISGDGSKWERTITNTNGEWSVLTGFDWKQTYGNKPLKGLKLSLLGASIEAYKNYIPAGNDPYYTGVNAGVNSVNQMWWKILCDETEMIPLVIDAWSGSSICYNYATDSTHSDTNKIPMCSDLRTGRLGTETENPDIILIVAGANDWTYAKSTTTPIGDWNGRTAVDRQAVISGQSTFMESYASLVAKLHENYPNAIIVGTSTEFTCRGTDLGITRVNDVGLVQNDYNVAIEKVCKIMGIPFIDLYDVGFTFENYYPTYCIDSETEATHPNAAGHAVIAKRFIEELPKVVLQFKG